LDIDGLERVQADYRGRLRAILEKELEDLDRRAALPAPARPELHEIDLSAVPEPAAADPAEPEVAETPASSPGGAGGQSSIFQRPSEAADSGPPPEARVGLDERLGRRAAGARRGGRLGDGRLPTAP